MNSNQESTKPNLNVLMEKSRKTSKEIPRKNSSTSAKIFQTKEHKAFSLNRIITSSSPFSQHSSKRYAINSAGSGVVKSEKAFTDTKLLAPMHPIEDIEIPTSYSFIRTKESLRKSVFSSESSSKIIQNSSDKLSTVARNTNSLNQVQSQESTHLVQQHHKQQQVQQQQHIQRNQFSLNSINELNPLYLNNYGNMIRHYPETLVEPLEESILPVLNGNPTKTQLPNFYHQKDTQQLFSTGRRSALSSDEVLVLFFHVSYKGDYNALKSLSRSPSLDINAVDDEGRTSLIYSCIGGHLDCATYLLEKGALLHLADNSGLTALHWAARFGHGKVVNFLLNAGADVRAEDYLGRTALHWATFSHSVDALEVILKWSAMRFFAKKVINNIAQKGQRQFIDVNCLDDEKMTPLMLACYNGHYKHVSILLKNHSNPELQDSEGKTALHWATFNKHVLCSIELLQNCLSLSKIKDNYGRFALHLACIEGNVAFVYLMLTMNPLLLDETDDLKRTPLHWACISGKSYIVKLVCDCGASINCLDKYSVSPLHYACQQNLQDSAHVIIRRGAHVDLEDQSKRTPLAWAAIQGNPEVLKILLQNGANANSVDINGCSPLHFAASGGFAQCCSILIKYKADVNIMENRQGHTPLLRAAISGHTEALLTLISEGANIHAEDFGRRTALHLAASAGHIDIINLLAGYGASITARDLKGETPLHEAAFYGKSDALLYLLERYANLNIGDANGVTPLHWASVNGHLSCIQILIANGANMNSMVRDDDRDTPLDYAYLNNNLDCASFLVSAGGLMAEEIFTKSATVIQKLWRTKTILKRVKKLKL